MVNTLAWDIKQQILAALPDMVQAAMDRFAGECVENAIADGTVVEDKDGMVRLPERHGGANKNKAAGQ